MPKVIDVLFQVNSEKNESEERGGEVKEIVIAKQKNVITKSQKGGNTKKS